MLGGGRLPPVDVDEMLADLLRAWKVPRIGDVLAGEDRRRLFLQALARETKVVQNGWALALGARAAP